MSGITVRATTVGTGVLGVSASRELPFTGHVLTLFVVVGVGLVLSGLFVRLLAARGE